MMFKIILKSAGNNRLKIISLIAHKMNISPKDAKRLVDTPGSEVGYGECDAIAKDLREYREAGAIVGYDFWPEGFNVSEWASPISADRIHCDKCGGALFFSVPKRTSKEDYRKFNATAKFPLSGGFGVFCPDCGNFVSMNFGDPDAK